MKKLLISLFLVFVLAMPLCAASLDLSLADMYFTTCLELKQGSDIFAGVKLDIANYKNLIYLGLCMVAPDINLTQKIVLAGLSLNLQTALKMLGWEWQIDEAIKLGGYMGINLMDTSKGTYAGVYINIKF